MADELIEAKESELLPVRSEDSFKVLLFCFLHDVLDNDTMAIFFLGIMGSGLIGGIIYALVAVKSPQAAILALFNSALSIVLTAFAMYVRGLKASKKDSKNDFES